MQYSSAFVAAMALAMVNAVSFTNSAFNGITAGQPITLTWTDASGPVTITLKNGASTNLNTVSTVASGQTSGSFTWNVPSTLTQDTYALEITDSSGTPNYSPQFELIGGATATGTSSAAASSSASSVVSSAVSSVSSVVSSQSAAASSSISSVVSSVSSLVDTITSNSTTSSAASSSTGAASNATTTGGSSSTKASSTGSKTSSSATGTSTTVPNANSAVQMASPLALVFLTFAAIFSLN